MYIGQIIYPRSEDGALGKSWVLFILNFLSSTEMHKQLVKR